jgi:hypothetical protein
MPLHGAFGQRFINWQWLLSIDKKLFCEGHAACRAAMAIFGVSACFGDSYRRIRQAKILPG